MKNFTTGSRSRLFALMVTASVIMTVTPYARAAEYALVSTSSSIAFRFHQFRNESFNAGHKGLTGVIDYDPENLDLTVVSVFSAFNSLRAGDNAQPSRLNRIENTILNSRAFFNLNDFETAFSSGDVTGISSPGKFDINGTLTLHGVMKPVVFHVVSVNVQGPIITLKALASISRSAFGLKWSKAVEDVAFMKDSVDVELSLVGTSNPLSQK